SSVTAALSQGDLATVGELLTDGHRSLRDDFEVSCPELDLAVATALSSGALGARLTGAGFGGSAIALMPGNAIPRLSESLDAEFAGRGWRAPTTLVVRPSHSARRLW
ncbi:MAG TPA: galactokinase, partial [Acidimicrobiales bacterium]|nr:galactokinase [Acidimicrobiales bacterium]